jgi:hypothetical protein
MSTSSTDTYDSVGIREDLSGIIYNVEPDTTPFLSMAPKTKAKSTTHDWQTDNLDAVSDNKVVEGADAAFSPATATVKLSNICQIGSKTAMVSGTLESTDRAGRDREMNYQMMKRGLELKRDMENALVGLNNAKAAGSNSVARETASVQSFINTNTSKGSGGADPAGTGADARTDGTQRVFTEAMLEAVVDGIFTNSGEFADTIMVGAFNKRKINDFTGRASTTDHNVAAGSIISAADVYKSDYGDLKIVPNRFSRSRDALVYNKSKFAVAYLRDMKTKEIAATGDAEKRQVLVEYSLEARNEASSGIIADLTTS